MKREDIRTICLFVIAVLLIGVLIIYNDYQNRKLDVNRKVDYIFNRFSYDNVLKEGKNLFFKGLSVINTENFSFELNRQDDVSIFGINNKEYKKILNFNDVLSTFSKSSLDEYMQDKKIINYDGHYYMEIYKDKVNKDYIGSIVELDKYDDNYVYFKTKNYYCLDQEYIGDLENEPECEYKVTLSKFELVLETDALRINNYENLKKIIQ